MKQILLEEMSRALLLYLLIWQANRNREINENTFKNIKKDKRYSILKI
jgi:hypothetical protein